jgi:hypothetical protein
MEGIKKMILIEKTEVMGFEQAIRGMRNPMNSWDKSDSYVQCREYDKLSDDKNKTYLIDEYMVGPKDQELMMKLVKGGPVHAKFRRMISVYVDITAPLYWWKEFDTYKVGTVANSCSTMHKIQEKAFDIYDFSHEHLINEGDNTWFYGFVDTVCNGLNNAREKFLETGEKKYWWQMIQLLPSSYNQKRTVMLNYEVLAGIYEHRKNHKLDEWKEFCKWIDLLPWSEIITCNSIKEDKNEH